MLFKRIGAVQILGLLLLGPTLSAQTPFLYSPEPVESNSLHFSAGLSLTILPQILVDGEGRLVPTLTARGRYGVSGGLSVEAGLRTNVLTTYVDLQGRYALDVDPLYFGGSLRTALWYGFAPIDGFNITALGWHISPAVEAGFTSGELLYRRPTKLLSHAPGGTALLEPAVARPRTHDALHCLELPGMARLLHL